MFAMKQLLHTTVSLFSCYCLFFVTMSVVKLYRKSILACIFDILVISAFATNSMHLGVTQASKTRSTQPCIPPGSLNRVPASAVVRVGMSPLPGGR